MKFSEDEIRSLSNISKGGRNLIIIFTTKLKKIMIKSIISYDQELQWRKDETEDIRKSTDTLKEINAPNEQEIERLRQHSCKNNFVISSGIIPDAVPEEGGKIKIRFVNEDLTHQIIHFYQRAPNLKMLTKSNSHKRINMNTCSYSLSLFFFFYFSLSHSSFPFLCC